MVFFQPDSPVLSTYVVGFNCDMIIRTCKTLHIRHDFTPNRGHFMTFIFSVQSFVLSFVHIYIKFSTNFDSNFKTFPSNLEHILQKIKIFLSIGLSACPCSCLFLKIHPMGIGVREGPQCPVRPVCLSYTAAIIGWSFE